jgi:hypothetical protein
MSEATPDKAELVWGSRRQTNRGYDLRFVKDYLGHRDPEHNPAGLAKLRSISPSSTEAANHVNICKLSSRESQVHRSVVSRAPSGGSPIAACCRFLR